MSKPASSSGKSKAKNAGPRVSARTLTLGVIFLVLAGVVAYIWGKGDGTEVPLDDQAQTNPDGTPAAAPQPIPQPDPATLPPGTKEEPPKMS